MEEWAGLENITHPPTSLHWCRHKKLYQNFPL